MCTKSLPSIISDRLRGEPIAIHIRCCIHGNDLSKAICQRTPCSMQTQLFDFNGRHRNNVISLRKYRQIKMQVSFAFVSDCSCIFLCVRESIGFGLRVCRDRMASSKCLFIFALFFFVLQFNGSYTLRWSLPLSLSLSHVFLLLLLLLLDCK